jgi:hypothetical protein
MLDEAEEALITNNQAHARAAMLFLTMGTEVMAQCGYDGEQQVLLDVQYGAREQGVGAFSRINRQLRHHS